MEKDKQVIIATHGHLADGFKSALNIILGDLPNFQTVCCYTSSDFDLNQMIINLMKDFDFEKKDLVVCTDMMGGSVNNGFVNYLGQYPFHLVTNINLAFIVDLLLFPGSVNATLLQEKANDDLAGVKYVNNLVDNFVDDLDDL